MGSIDEYGLYIIINNNVQIEIRPRSSWGGFRLITTIPTLGGYVAVLTHLSTTAVSHSLVIATCLPATRSTHVHCCWLLLNWYSRRDKKYCVMVILCNISQYCAHDAHHTLVNNNCCFLCTLSVQCCHGSCSLNSLHQITTRSEKSDATML